MFPPISYSDYQCLSCELPMRRLLSFIAFAAWMFVAGCAIPNIYIDVERQAETGVLPGEQISVLLLRYRNEGNQVKHLSPIEERFEQCIRAGMQMVKDDLMFLPSADFRKVVSADTTTALAAFVLDDGIQSPDSLLPLLVESATASRPAEEKVRYVVLIVGSYDSSKTGWQTGASEGGFGVVREGEQRSSIEATVLDLKHARVAGAARSRAYGYEAAGGGVFIIIPFPLYVTSMTESRACTNLGKALARFISGTGTP